MMWWKICQKFKIICLMKLKLFLPKIVEEKQLSMLVKIQFPLRIISWIFILIWLALLLIWLTLPLIWLTLPLIWLSLLLMWDWFWRGFVHFISEVNYFWFIFSSLFWSFVLNFRLLVLWFLNSIFFMLQFVWEVSRWVTWESNYRKSDYFLKEIKCVLVTTKIKNVSAFDIEQIRERIYNFYFKVSKQIKLIRYFKFEQ